MKEFNSEEFNDWLSGEKDVLFRKSQFEDMGLGNHYVFQTLVFMGHAAQQMSLAQTIAEKTNVLSEEVKQEMNQLLKRYNELQFTIQKHSFALESDSAGREII